MKPVVLYFSRTGNTKLLAEAIAQQANAPIFDIAALEPSIVNDYDIVILGTPVEGSSPAKETRAFVERLPTVSGKKLVLFTTYRIFGNERTMKAIEKILAPKGYETMLKVPKKGMKPGQPADFTKVLDDIKKFLT